MANYVNYVENRLFKLKSLQLFQVDEERDLTAFEDGVITTSVLHVFLDYLSTEEGGKYLVLPASYLLKMQKDVDSLWKNLHQNEGVFHGFIRNLSDYNTILVPLCPDSEILQKTGKRDQPSLFIVSNLIKSSTSARPTIHIWKAATPELIDSGKVGVGLTEREVQLLVVLRRLFQNALSAAETLPSHTLMLRATIV